jgi:hypothetical protein
MEKIDLGYIKISHRFRNGVDEKMNLYNKKQKLMIINEVKNKPDDMRKEDVLELYGIAPPVYYSWVRSEKKREIFNLANNICDVKVPDSKKKWIIEITAENEERAERYLKMLQECFEIAATHKLPIDAATMSDLDRGEILTCKRI